MLVTPHTMGRAACRPGTDGRMTFLTAEERMLNVITWTAAGLGAGWVARRVLGGARDVGWAGELVAGAFGAVPPAG